MGSKSGRYKGTASDRLEMLNFVEREGGPGIAPVRGLW
jgi:hypothetical protein